MQKLKNSVVGFFISFLGSIPLGYLNLIGYEIYSKKGFQSTVDYLFGVVIIEGLVVFLTLKFAYFLANQKKWMQRIDVFTILFLLVLAFSFFTKSDKNKAVSIYTLYLPFFTGLILSGLNFIQIPFWTGWNLYLVNNNYISVKKPYHYFYLVGTLLGTFGGMLGLILGLNYFSKLNANFNYVFISHAIPIVFFGLAFFQMVQFYRKYYSDKNQK